MYSKIMERKEPLEAAFYKSKRGNQPCRDFLLSLTRDDRREVGADIFAVQKGFPMGLPLCRKMTSDLWEVRSTVSDGICRIFFAVDNNVMVLLHGFIKKSQKTPQTEIDTATSRLNDYKEQNK